ncbi:MAG: ABC-2 transporter permease [Ruminiclostridium sp.]|nr:ABC-2 transporter permease [Ruminiclostridium sp.]
MSGLLYKNFRINRSSFIFSLCTAILCCIVTILFAVFIGGADSIKDDNAATSIGMVNALLYYLAFLLPSLTTSMLFEADENKTCCAFAMSLPQGGKGHVESKYYYLLILNITVLFIAFTSDMISFAIYGGKVSATMALMLIFCWRLLVSAIEVPFVIRFGSQHGVEIKGVVIFFIFMLIMIYFFFGDISWLMSVEDPVEAFVNWLNSGDTIFWISLFPFISVAAYYLSCRISVKLFRKGAENYEQ